MRPALFAVLALFFLNGALFGSWAARVPAFKDRFDLSPDALGLILLCLAGGAIAAFPLAGRLIDRHGAGALSLGLACIYAVTLPLIALAPSVALLACALVLFGASFGAMDVVMNAWGADVEAARDRPLMPQLHAVFSLGAGLGAGGAALAVALGLGPVTHFTLTSVVLALIALPVVARAKTQTGPPPPRATAPGKSRGAILPKGALFLVGLVAAATGLSEAAVADWSAVYLTAVTTAPPAVAALGFAAFSATMVIVRLSGGWIVAQVGAVAATRVSGMFLALGAVVVVLGRSGSVTLAGFALIGVGCALVIPLAFARAANDPHTAPGTAIAQVALLAYGGLLLGPPLIGFIAARSDYPTSFALLAALGLLVGALAGTLRAMPLEDPAKNSEVTGQ